MLADNLLHIIKLNKKYLNTYLNQLNTRINSDVQKYNSFYLGNNMNFVPDSRHS